MMYRTLSVEALSIEARVGINLVCSVVEQAGLAHSSLTTSCTRATSTGSLLALINTARHRVDMRPTLAAVKLASTDTTVQQVSRMRERTSDDA